LREKRKKPERKAGKSLKIKVCKKISFKRIIVKRKMFKVIPE